MSIFEELIEQATIRGVSDNDPDRPGAIFYSNLDIKKLIELTAKACVNAAYLQDHDSGDEWDSGVRAAFVKLERNLEYKMARLIVQTDSNGEEFPSVCRPAVYASCLAFWIDFEAACNEWLEQGNKEFIFAQQSWETDRFFDATGEFISPSVCTVDEYFAYIEEHGAH